MAEFNEDLADVALSRLPAKSGTDHFSHFSNHKSNPGHAGAGCFGTAPAGGVSPSPNTFSSSKRPRDQQAPLPKTKLGASHTGHSSQAPSALYQPDTYRNTAHNAIQQTRSSASHAPTRTTRGTKTAPLNSCLTSGYVGPQARRQHVSSGSTEQFNTFLNQNLFKKS